MHAFRRIILSLSTSFLIACLSVRLLPNGKVPAKPVKVPYPPPVAF